ncbi:MAG: hypothetical protein HY295_01875 [Thaumarchaeota archaeon]|nr:hypothetical protein [Nitrososphaerota archaeon]
MKNKKPRKIEQEKKVKELEHEKAQEQLHQAELEIGYEQDEKFEESQD